MRLRVEARCAVQSLCQSTGAFMLSLFALVAISLKHECTHTVDVE